MALLEVKWRPSDSDLRVFAVAQLVAASIGAWLLHRQLHASITACALSAVSIGVVFVGFWAPRWLRPLFLVWTLAAFPLGWAISHLLLLAVYFSVVTPIGLLLRLSGRDSLQLRQRSNLETYWSDRPKPSESVQYFRQF